MAREVEICSSVGGSPLLSRLAEELTRLGCPSVEYSGIRGEDYREAHTPIARLCLRARMYIGFPLRLILHSRRRPRGSGSIITTNPFFMPWLTSFLARNGGRRVVNLLYDLYPDALELAGTIRQGSLPSRFIGRTTSAAFKNCDATVFLGERLREHAEARYGPARRATVIPVGADGSPFRDHPPTAIGGNEPVTLLHCGNLGRLHDHQTLLDGLARLPDDAGTGEGVVNGVRKLDVRIHGNGVGFRRLQEQSADRHLSFGPNLESTEWVKQMRAAEVGLVMLAEGAERVLMPSKTYSALVAGQAIVAVCPERSDLADLVREHRCGWVVPTGNPARMAEVLAEIRRDPAALLEKRRNAFQAGHQRYDLAILAKKWLELLETIGCVPEEDVPIKGEHVR